MLRDRYLSNYVHLLGRVSALSTITALLQQDILRASRMYAEWRESEDQAITKELIQKHELSKQTIQKEFLDEHPNAPIILLARLRALGIIKQLVADYVIRKTLEYDAWEKEHLSEIVDTLAQKVCNA